MPLHAEFEKKLDVWVTAGIIDAPTADRLRSYEADHQRSSRWLIIIAVSLGAVMLGAGILLFVAAHWDKLSPAQRFSLVLGMVAVFHLVAAGVSKYSDVMPRILHALGTVVLGAGIFLAGQIFNLQEHWPGGIMLWALGALLGYIVLRDFLQATLFALLAPAWIISEWAERTQYQVSSERYIAVAIASLAIVYFTSVFDSQPSPLRRSLRWVGGILLLPAVILLANASDYSYFQNRAPLSLTVRLIAYGVWLTAVFFVSAVLRKRLDLWTAGFLLWLVAFTWLSSKPAYEIVVYLWCAVGSAALIACGVAEQRSERINMGVVGFALTLICFYFSSVMDKLGRSFALMLFGIAFLVGGWMLEKMRRSLIAHVKAVQP